MRMKTPARVGPAACESSLPVLEGAGYLALFEGLLKIGELIK